MARNFYILRNDRGQGVISNTPADPGPMLYSARALHDVETLGEWFGCKLKKDALVLAKRDGRRTVTEEDVWTAFNKLNPKDFDSDEESGDGK